MTPSESKAPEGTQPSPGGTDEKPESESPRRSGGRAARLQAEDAAARTQRWRSAADLPLGDAPPEELATAARLRPRGTVRIGVFLLLLLIAGAAASTPLWYPRLMELRQTVQERFMPAPEATVPAPVPAPAPAPQPQPAPAQPEPLAPSPEPRATSADLDALGEELEEKLAALVAVKREAPVTAVTSIGDTVGEQAKQLAALRARVAALEAALGNATHFDELSKRMDALEGKTAAVAKRIDALGTG